MRQEDSFRRRILAGPSDGVLLPAAAHRSHLKARIPISIKIVNYL